MGSIIENLSLFNAKERFYLIGQALGNQKFQLSDAFIDELQKAIKIPIPSKYFVAMDYHIDWIFASLQCSADSKKKIHQIEEGCITGSQEDVDFIIAFDKDGVTHMVFLEAKGFSGWSNKQMNSKARRLTKIFAKKGDKWPGVIPHFLLISPKKSKQLSSAEWPEWMAPDGEVKWLMLHGTENRERVIRCDEHGKESDKGNCWKVKHR